MKKRFRLRTFAGLTTLAALAAIVTMILAGGAGAVVAGAGYSTSLSNGTCIHGTVVNCNEYNLKTDVYVSGGPTAGGIKTAGVYYFTIIAPGSQHGGYIDGATGNLSSGTCGGGTASDRSFHVSIDANGNPVIDTNTGNTTLHPSAVNSADKFVIQAAPFCDTPNSGGVYILAICAAGATSDSQCKFDAFKVDESVTCVTGCTPNPFGAVSGEKYYDADLSGTLTAGDTPIQGWRIDWTDGDHGVFSTDANGLFSGSFTPDTYSFTEEQATNTTGAPFNLPAWIQTGNTTGQFSDSGGNSTTLASKAYSVGVVANGSTSGLNFGNVCLGGNGGGLTLGFWSNKNGQLLETTGDFTMLTGLYLRNADGTDRDFLSSPANNKKALNSWLLNATATNMAYMLSAQLAAMELNVAHNSAIGSEMIYVSGTLNAFMTVNAVMGLANASLGTDPVTVASGTARSYQEMLKSALDAGNNNVNFVQPDLTKCPAPTFPTGS